MAVYRDLADHYRKKIKSGELADGDQLPTEADLSIEHNVSESTVHRFLKLLKTEELIYTTHRGTFVGPRPLDPRVEAARNQTIHCASKPMCGNTIEFYHQAQLSVVLSQVGWIWRGSQAGRLYYCHCCAPYILKNEKERGLR